MHGWSTQQLTEFLAAIGAANNRAAAIRLTTERAAESVEAEVAAVVISGKIADQIGFPAGAVPPGLAGTIVLDGQSVEVGGLGTCRTLCVALEGEKDAWLAVARVGDDTFRAEERALLRGMARILSMTLRNLALLTRERAARLATQRQAAEIRQRQKLLEALSGVQRMIVAREPQQAILDRLVTDVGQFVGDPIVGLRLAHPDGVLRIVASQGLDFNTLDEISRAPVGLGAGAMALAEDRLVVIDDYARHPAAVPTFVRLGLTTAAAAPVHAEGGRAIGSLMVASRRRGRRYRADQLEALAAFAEHASLAVTDSARTSQMIHLAMHDALTGLPNRALFIDRLDHRLREKRRKSAAAVLFIDIDDLKRVNDTLGHSAGDEILIETGRRLASTVRAADTVARLGGDEFTVLLDSVSGPREANAVAERLLDAFDHPMSIAGRSLTLRVSVGVRLARARTDRTEDVLRGADLAMYEAKARNGGVVAMFRPELDDRAVRRLELQEDLRAAIAKGEFRLLYQPIVSLYDGTTGGVEALIRWERPGVGLVSPVEFISVAEETGLIIEMGAWVLGEACRTVVAFDDRCPQPLGVSVNLSARQLMEDSLLGSVASALSSSRLAPERLTLEITESVLLADALATVERLEALRRLGVKVAIDDFGTGYSSLGYLRRLPLDAVKIDRTFIERLSDDPRQAALVRSIVELCRSLELETVAEGVETEAQARRLLELGCEMAQGFHLGRPMPIEEMVLGIAAGEKRLAAARRASPSDVVRRVDPVPGPLTAPRTWRKDLPALRGRPPVN